MMGCHFSLKESLTLARLSWQLRVRRSLADLNHTSRTWIMHLRMNPPVSKSINRHVDMLWKCNIFLLRAAGVHRRFSLTERESRYRIVDTAALHGIVHVMLQEPRLSSGTVSQTAGVFSGPSTRTTVPRRDKTNNLQHLFATWLRSESLKWIQMAK